MHVLWTLSAQTKQRAQSGLKMLQNFRVPYMLPAAVGAHPPIPRTLCLT